VLRMRSIITAEQKVRLPYMDLRVEALSPEQIGELANSIVELRMG